MVDFIQQRNLLSRKLKTLIPENQISSTNGQLTSFHEATLDINRKNVVEKRNAELIKRGMSPKKVHEVSNYACFIHQHFDSVLNKNSNFLLDIGSGLGYLDQFLWYVFGYRVVAIESSPDHTSGAEKRNNSILVTDDCQTRYVDGWDLVSRA